MELMKKTLKILLAGLAILVLSSCEEESFTEFEFNVPNQDSIPVILSNTFQRVFQDGDTFIEEVPGPWFFLNYNIVNNSADEDLVVVILKLRTTSLAGTSEFEVFYLDSTFEPTTITIPAGGGTFPAAGGDQFSEVTIHSLTGEDSADEVDFDSLIGSSYSIELQMIGYTLDSDGVAKTNVVKKVQLTGNAN